MKWFGELYCKKISASGLAVFRVAFYLNFFFEVLSYYSNRRFFFDPIPYIESFELDFTYPLILWLVIILLIIFGFFTRFLLIVNYLFTLVFISTLSSFEYHMDYVYSGVNFVCIFLPMSRVFSLDNLLLNDRKSSKVSVLYYYLPVYVGIGLVYFDSILYKLDSIAWMNGLGVWLPASIPQLTIWNDQWLLNQELLMYFLGYLTLFFEVVFIFVFWIKKVRVPLLIIGVSLHFGIFLEFPIPYFAFGMIALYTLLVPVSLWDKMLVYANKILKLEKKIGNLKVGVLKIFISDTFVKSGLAFLFLALLFFQLNISFHSPFIAPIKTKSLALLKKVNLKTPFLVANNSINNFSKSTLGITKHAVFVDSHYIGYEHIVAITYVDNLGNEHWLPFIDESGLANVNVSGSAWAYLGFRSNGANVNEEKFKKGFIRYVAFWAYKNDIDLNKATFKVKVKKIELPDWEWEYDYLKNQIKKPWINAGVLIWKDEKPSFELQKSIEEI